MESTTDTTTTTDITTEDKSKSIQHLQSYPVVADACGYVWNYYTWAKEKSGIVNYTCSLAENGFVTVTTPLARKLEPQVKAIDEVANNQLNRLDNRFPAVKKPTKELWEDSCQYYQETVRDPITQKYEAVRSSIHSGKEKATNYVKQAVDSADGYVDSYLPSDTEEHPEAEKMDVTRPPEADEAIVAVDRKKEASPSLEESENAKESDSVTTRSKEVLHKTQRRLYQKGKRNAKEVQQVVQNAITNVIASVGLLDTLQTARAGAGDLNVEFWGRLEELQKSDQKNEELLSSEDSGTGLNEVASEQSSDAEASPENRVLSLTARTVCTAGQALTVLSDMIYLRLDANNKNRWDHANQSLQSFYLKLKESPELTSAYLRSVQEKFQQINESVVSGVQNAARRLSGERRGSESSASAEEEQQQPHQELGEEKKQ